MTEDEREPIMLEWARSRDQLCAAIAYLDRAERAAATELGSSGLAGIAVPLVDETERERLERAISGYGGVESAWRPFLVRQRDLTVGYAALRPEDGGRGRRVSEVAEVACDRAGELGAVLEGIIDHLAAGTSVRAWVRRAGGPELAAASRVGFLPERRLAVLGRRVEAPVEVRQAAGVRVRPHRPGRDDAAVVAVLEAAYRGTAEGGWDLARFRSRAAADWFEPGDLLLAETDGDVVGLHWLKRRSPTTGEVYNLAVRPDVHGTGIGGLLLAAGLGHLAATGIGQVVLWVDRSNGPARALYVSHGFELLWEDVLLAGQASSGPRDPR